MKEPSHPVFEEKMCIRDRSSIVKNENKTENYFMSSTTVKKNVEHYSLLSHKLLRVHNKCILTDFARRSASKGTGNGYSHREGAAAA